MASSEDFCCFLISRGVGFGSMPTQPWEASWTSTQAVSSEPVSTPS